MFGFLKREKSSQPPLTDLKTVTRWMQDLPAGDVYSAQGKVVENLIQFNRAQLPTSKERLQVLMHVDENARDIQYSLCAQYLRNPRMSKEMESKLWQAIHAYYWEITRGYHGFLMDFVSNPGGSKIESLVPLITARAIEGFGNIIKWRYFRYEVIDEKLWLRLHNLYRIAEFDNFARSAIRCYGHSAKPETCLGKYTQALLLSRFGNGTLAPRQIDMIDIWLNHWSDLVRLDTQHVDRSHVYFVDTGKGVGLQRIQRPGTESTLRYMDIRDLTIHAKSVAAAIKTGTNPVALGLGEDFRMPDGLTLLEHVIEEWSSKPGQNRRSSVRKPSEGTWGIALGMDNICSKLSKVSGEGRSAPLSPDELMDINLYGFVTDRTKKQHQHEQTVAQEKIHERWRQMDMNDNGLGFVVDPGQSPWVKIGKLLALRHEDERDWVVGSIKRIARVDADRQIVGVGLFGGDITGVQIKLDDKSRNLSYEVDDISLPTESQIYNALIWRDQGEAESLLMEGAGYARGRKYVVVEKNGSRLIQLDAVLSKGDDWLRASFKVLSPA